MSFEQLLTTDDDARRTSNDHDSSLWANGSGVLKTRGPEGPEALTESDIVVQNQMIL